MLGGWFSPSRRFPHGAAAVARVEEDGEAARVADLARRFTSLVRGCCSGGDECCWAPRNVFDARLAEARARGVRAIATFAAGLEQDGAAVRAALTTPWKNGQAESQSTRLKLIKQTMYRRAGFDLPRRRVLLHA